MWGRRASRGCTTGCCQRCCGTSRTSPSSSRCTSACARRWSAGAPSPSCAPGSTSSSAASQVGGLSVETCTGRKHAPASISSWAVAGQGALGPAMPILRHQPAHLGALHPECDEVGDGGLRCWAWHPSADQDVQDGPAWAVRLGRVHMGQKVCALQARRQPASRCRWTLQRRCCSAAASCPFRR